MAQPSENEKLQELAERLSKGDESALTELAHLLVPSLTGKLVARFGRLLHHEDVDDVVAQTLYRLWERRDQYRSERVSFAGWAYVIARNFALDHLRQRARQWKHIPALWNELAQRPVRDSKESYWTQEKIAIFRSAFRRLGPTERRILLASVNNPSRWAADLATKSQVDAGVIRQRRFRALRKLRDELERLGLTEE